MCNIYIYINNMQTDGIPMINTRANERFVVISEFGSSRLPLYISPLPPPVHMSSPRQQSARLARQPAIDHAAAAAAAAASVI